jgi:hypothetical protein
MRWPWDTIGISKDLRSFCRIHENVGCRSEERRRSIGQAKLEQTATIARLAEYATHARETLRAVHLLADARRVIETRNPGFTARYVDVEILVAETLGAISVNHVAILSINLIAP